LSMSAPEVAYLLAAVAALMIAAHTLGTLFARFRQPRVIGEIAAGLVLEPDLKRLMNAELRNEGSCRPRPRTMRQALRGGDGLAGTRQRQ
jgi:Kef-type K+ transport system membrane component KefB